METKDLRIGNWINEELLGNCIVNEIGINSVFVEYTSKQYYGISFENINPIPLTEQIFIKCGFEKQCNIFYINEIALIWSIDGRYQYKMTLHKHRTYLKYLHQLQNLYFALTGKELEITL